MRRQTDGACRWHIQHVYRICDMRMFVVLSLTGAFKEIFFMDLIEFLILMTDTGSYLNS